MDSVCLDIVETIDEKFMYWTNGNCYTGLPVIYSHGYDRGLASILNENKLAQKLFLKVNIGSCCYWEWIMAQLHVSAQVDNYVHIKREFHS